MNAINALKKLRRILYGIRFCIPGLREGYLYEKMVGPLGFWNQLSAYQLNICKRFGLQPDHCFLDIGCGPLQGGIAFIKYLDPQKYVGIDNQENRINAAHRQVARYGLGNKNPFLVLSETYGEQELSHHRFDFFWSSQVLYYLDDEKIRSLFRFVAGTMNANGKLLCDIIGLEHSEFTRPLCGYHLHTIQSLQKSAAPFGLAAVDHGCIVDYGYPSKLKQSTNHLIEVCRNQPGN